MEVWQGLDSIAYRWLHTDDWTPRVLGIAVHAEIVRVHPFADGNGRTTRLLADLVLAAAQRTESPDLLDWDVDETASIALPRQYDRSRDPPDWPASSAASRSASEPPSGDAPEAHPDL